MAFSREVVERRIDEFKQACCRCGLKVTHQRLEIYRELAATEEHPDADVIWSRVRKRIPTISRDTVYRNLKTLAEAGVISIVGMSHERLRFDANMGQHHHFVCVRCGLIRDFCSDQLERIEIPIEAEGFGKPMSVHMEVKGVCAKCQGPDKTGSA